MDKLLSLISEIGQDDEEDTVIRFKDVAWSGSAIEVSLEILTSGLEVKTRDVWIRCSEVLAYEINGEAASSLNLMTDHPLLWRFIHDNASAFFYGVPPDTCAAMCALYDAHQTAVGDWFSLETQLNSGITLRELLGSGNGLLAQGPVPLLAVYKNALSHHGVEVEIRNPYPPGGRMSSPESQKRLRDETKALLVGGSYITGIGWAADWKWRAASGS